MVFAKLRSVALIKDKDQPLVSEVFQPPPVGWPTPGSPALVMPAIFIKGNSKLLYGGDNYLIGIIFRQQAIDESIRVRVFLNTIFLKLVEFPTGLTVKVFAIDNKETLVDVFIEFKKGRGLEGSQCFTRTGCMPDIAVATILIDTVYDGFDGIDLVRPHHQQLPLACNQYHVLANHFTKSTFRKELVCKLMKTGYFSVIPACKLINRQKLLMGIEGKVFFVVVCEVVRIRVVRYDKELDKAE